MANRVLLVLVLALAMAAATAHGYAAGLRVGFYSRTCPRAEAIVRLTVEPHFQTNHVVTPKLLRTNFHDCFVQGCNGLILIDGTNTEKTAVPNLSLGPAFPVIDDAKARLEAVCRRVVSCADIVALAACDSMTKRLSWQVLTGRRDGRVSSASDTSNLPLPFDSIDVQKQKFSDFGLNTHDLVTLVGGHTIGTVACQFVTCWLYDFNNTIGASDPTNNPYFLPQLKALCPQNGDGIQRIFLDTGSSSRFDTSYFSNLRNGRGILTSDQISGPTLQRGRSSNTFSIGNQLRSQPKRVSRVTSLVILTPTFNTNAS